MRTKIALVALTLLAASCRTNGENSYLDVIKVFPPTATAGATGSNTISCKLDPTADEFTSLPYVAGEEGSIGMLVQNSLVSTAALNSVLRADSGIFFPHTVIIDYEIIPSSAGAAPAERELPINSDAIPSGNKGTIGVGVFDGISLALPPGTFIRATLTVKGKLADGSAARTNQREYLFQVSGSVSSLFESPWGIPPSGTTAAGTCL
jgi:hypothetical protein